jgi:hypothetical protein
VDQDFHYYGTFYAARIAGIEVSDATLIAKASNFIDFLHEGEYGGYWRLVRESIKQISADRYTVIGDLTNPRYTFQAGKLSTGLSPEDGLWCSYHFTPGNYPDPPGTFTPLQVHGIPVAKELPKPPQGNAGRHHEIRDTPNVLDKSKAKLLNRPMSGLSRSLVADTIDCANNYSRLRKILQKALGAAELLPENQTIANQTLARFRLCLLGARAHVLADTWAHQDFCGLDHEINTYYDVNGAWFGRQSIDYCDSKGWHNVVLSAMSHENLQAVPNKTSYLGHGWMGHFPDYSFVKFRYRPWWRRSTDEAFLRDNPVQYRSAFIELCSLFRRANGAIFHPQMDKEWLDKAQLAISTPCEIANEAICPRAFSSRQWVRHLSVLGQPTYIDAKLEPHPGTVLDGLLEKGTGTSGTRYGTYTVHARSDLYLFQIAIDYHFHFVKNWLKKNNILEFTGTWSTEPGALSPSITELF